VTENRRDVRYSARIVAKVVRRGETLELLTNDVSFRGAFLRTDTPPALRQLVRVTFALPNGEVVGGHAMVVHVVPPQAADEVKGVGLQFWGTLDNGKPWEKFIHELKTQEKVVAAPSVSDKIRRASERFKLSIDVVLDGKTLVTRDVSETGMAIRTDSEMQIGMRCQVRLRAAREAIDADVIVRRMIAERAFKGLGVEFVDMTTEARRALIAFLERHAPRDEAVFVEPGDPKLL
jgi:PilZ domain